LLNNLIAFLVILFITSLFFNYFVGQERTVAPQAGGWRQVGD
jgi:hypothetical protein